MRFPESKLAHQWIDPLQPGPGLEIGGSAHNPWGIPHTVNVDFTDSMDTVFKREEVRLCGEALPVDLVAYGDHLPFAAGSYHWLLHSHVFEHLPDPIGALLEWHRVLVPGGIIYGHIPNRNAHPPDRSRQITALTHLIRDCVRRETLDTHPINDGCECQGGHYHVFDEALLLAIVDLLNCGGPIFEIIDARATDDKVGNGHVLVLKVLEGRCIRDSLLAMWATAGRPITASFCRSDT